MQISISLSVTRPVASPGGVVAANQPPVAIDDTGYTTAFQTPITLTDLRDNDTDPDGDPLTIIAVASPVGGSVVLDGNGDPVFTPATGFTGVAFFTYTVSDGQGGTDTATASITVSPAAWDIQDNGDGSITINAAPSADETPFQLIDNGDGTITIQEAA